MSECETSMKEVTESSRCPRTELMWNPLRLVGCVMENTKKHRCKPCACHYLKQTLYEKLREFEAKGDGHSLEVVIGYDEMMEAGEKLPCDNAIVSVTSVYCPNSLAV